MAHNLWGVNNYKIPDCLFFFWSSLAFLANLFPMDIFLRKSVLVVASWDSWTPVLEFEASFRLDEVEPFDDCMPACKNQIWPNEKFHNKTSILRVLETFTKHLQNKRISTGWHMLQHVVRTIPTIKHYYDCNFQYIYK